jgi:hypothetical protein
MKKLLVFFILAGCAQDNPVDTEKSGTAFVQNQDTSLLKDTVKSIDTPGTFNKKTVPADMFSVNIIFSDTLGYGYEILNDGKLYIRQPIIPAIPGNHGFKTQADAQKVGNRVKEKLEKGIMPPTVSIDELKKMKVI